MTWIVEWKGQQLDIDPMEFSGLELSEIKRVSGLTFPKLVEALKEVDGDAIRVLFWISMRRNDPGLAFGDFEGPTLRFYIGQLDGLVAAMDDLGKAMTPASDGGPSSSSNADSPEEPTLML